MVAIDDTYLWILDRQKEDYQQIKAQVRRYFLAVVSGLIVLFGIILGSDYQFMDSGESAEYLAENDIVWQLGIFPPEYAQAFVESFTQIPVVFMGVGVGLFVPSLQAAYELEKSKGCKPRGDAYVLTEDKPGVIYDWIKTNDTLISGMEEARYRVMDSAQIGSKLIIVAFVMRFTISRMTIIFLFLLIIGASILFNALHTTSYLSGTLLHASFGFIVLFIISSRPLMFAQEITGYSISNFIVSIYFLIILGISATYSIYYYEY